MDTITQHTMRVAGDELERAQINGVIHTVTVTLNGYHGGADVIVQGVDGDSEFERTIAIK